MSTTFTTVAALSLASLCFGQNTSTYPFRNQYPSDMSPGSAPYTWPAEPPAYPDLFNAANMQPNASHTVQFVHDTYSSNDTVRGNWSWTVRVSDLEVPDNSSTTGSLPPNSRVAYTTYDFSWPENGNLNEAVQAERATDSGGTFVSCAYLFSATFPQNVSSRYNEADGSNCTTVLGEECVNNITAALNSRRECASTDIALSEVQAACGDTFGAVRIGGGYSVGGYPFGNTSVSANSSNVVEKGQTYSYSLSFPYTAENLTTYYQTKDDVHVLLLAGLRSDVLCNRAGNGSSLTGAASSRTSSLELVAMGTVSILTALVNLM